MKRIALFALMLSVLYSPSALAMGQNHDEYSLELKGYSAEMIQPVEAQIARQEGRFPPPAPSKTKQAWYNMLNCNWIDPLEPFTYDRVDGPAYPKPTHD